MFNIFFRANEQGASGVNATSQVLVTPHALPDLGSEIMEEANVDESQDVEMEGADEELEEVVAPPQMSSFNQLRSSLGELYLEIDIGFAVGLFSNNPTHSSASSPLVSPAYPRRVRYRSQAAGFDQEETSLDVESLHQNTSHTSSFLSVGDSVGDSGTGTGTEDNGTLEIDR